MLENFRANVLNDPCDHISFGNSCRKRYLHIVLSARGYGTLVEVIRIVLQITIANYSFRVSHSINVYSNRLC